MTVPSERRERDWHGNMESPSYGSLGVALEIDAMCTITNEF
jgi:hypothetical protein